MLRKISIPVVFSLVLFLHVIKLDKIPIGLFVDETSIGNNAYLIATYGFDENKVPYPLFFKAFGEYKNPLYIYVDAIVFKVLGFSEFKLRFTSFLFFALFIVVLYFFIKRIFPDNKYVWLYALISAGTLPWFFTVSRIAFEAVSQLTVVTLLLFFIYKTYEEDFSTSPFNTKKLFFAIAAGGFLGLSVYSYTSSRLLAFPMALAVVLIYIRKRYFLRNICFILSFMASLIPYAVFVQKHPVALTVRFKETTYLYDPALSYLGKALIFVKNYISYFTPQYLLTKGDANLRLGIGNFGVIYVTVFGLFVFWIYLAVRKRHIKENKFLKLITAFLVISPVAGAMTYECPQSLRGQLIGLFLLILSAYAFDELKNYKLKKLITTTVFITLIAQATLFITLYFFVYPPKTVEAFIGYGFKYAFKKGIDYNPKKLNLVNDEFFTYIRFYKYVLEKEGGYFNPALSDKTKGTCYLYYDKTEKADRALLQICKGTEYIDDGMSGSRFRVRCCQGTD
ncbi:MAG: glycosyltransferase family 39 protein [Nitrospirae bacterium]|nr:glycosyltransferase family 39 protein [Nitrospirota bacterium]